MTSHHAPERPGEHAREAGGRFARCLLKASVMIAAAYAITWWLAPGAFPQLGPVPWLVPLVLALVFIGSYAVKEYRGIQLRHSIFGLSESVTTFLIGCLCLALPIWAFLEQAAPHPRQFLLAMLGTLGVLDGLLPRIRSRT